MNLRILTEDDELSVVNRVMDGHAALANGEISRADWNDQSVYPRDVFLFISDLCGDESAPFVVVDNRGGECFVEQFATLDGAILYACDVYMTCELQDSWDYAGSVKDRGSLTI